MPAQPTLDAFLTHARAMQARALPLIGHVRHDSQMPGAVYIGRDCYGLAGSPYANPYRIGTDGTRAEVIEQYERWLRNEIWLYPDFLVPLLEAWQNGPLVLTCWCRRVGAERPACHGDTLVALLRERYADAR
jgi:hypothetical protein